MKRLFLAGLLAASTLSMAAVKFPYPQAQTYPYAKNISDVWNCAGQTASTMLLKKFEEYMSSYYEESGDQARIKFDNKNETVSEGIGYGMILCVYFSSNTKSYQSQFDKLWNYYKKNMDGNGVMNWKINAFGGAAGTGGATDAEEDVAFALAMAYYQFGESKYKDAAATLIANMRKSEFESNGLHKLGDQWDNWKNPSYVSPAAYEIFKEFDAGQSSFWESAISANYKILLANRNSSTGIPSGWAEKGSYNPTVGNNGYNFAGYDYDAVRAPWRWAWSYAWYGHSQAKDLSEKLAKWVSQQPFGKLYINMKTDGSANLQGEPCKSNGCMANGSSIGSLSSVLIIDEAYHSKLNENYSVLLNQQPGYFHSNLRLLTGLLMTGNMVNFAKATPVTPATFEVPESCNEVEVLHENSGAYGWNSTSVVLSGETPNSVHMGAVIQGDHRELVRHLTGLKNGSKYTLSFKALQTLDETLDAEGSNLWLTYAAQYDSLDTEKKYCGAMKKLSFTDVLEVECEFTANGEDLFVYWTLNNWSNPQVSLSDFSVKGADGKDLVEEQQGIADVVIPTGVMNVALSGKTLLVQLPTADMARVTVMDMQGRVVSNVNMKSRAQQIPLNLSQGNYMVRVKQGANSVVRSIRIAE